MADSIFLSNQVYIHTHMKKYDTDRFAYVQVLRLLCSRGIHYWSQVTTLPSVPGEARFQVSLWASSAVQCSKAKVRSCFASSDHLSHRERTRTVDIKKTTIKNACPTCCKSCCAQSVTVRLHPKDFHLTF